MPSITDNTYNLGTIIPIGETDLKADDPDGSKTTAPGQLSYMRDAFGLRIFQYLRCRQSGGQAAGEAASKPATVSANISGGSTITLTTAGLTAGAHKGWLCVITNNNDAAGASPEGEVAIVASNTATTIYLDSQRPLSVAAAAGDVVNLVSIFDVEDSAAGDSAKDGAGICFNGISVDNWGWYQAQGVYPYAVLAGTVARNKNIAAGAAGLKEAQSSNGLEGVWGHCVATRQNDVSGGKAIVFIDVLSKSFAGDFAP